MKGGGRLTGPEAIINARRAVIAYFRLSVRHAKGILGEVERAVASWRKVGRVIGMTDRELEQFIDAFEHRERKAAQKIVR